MAKINENLLPMPERFETTISDTGTYHDWIYDVKYVVDCAVSGLNGDTNEYWGITAVDLTQAIKTVNGRRIFSYKNNNADYIGRKLIAIIQK